MTRNPGSFAHLRHELRTPLNQIIGYSELLQEDAEEVGKPGMVDDLQKITQAARNLLGIINDVLDDTGRRSDLPPESRSNISIRQVSQADDDDEPPPAASSRGGRLLVVDDQPDNREVLSRRLLRDGYAVETARDGVEALEMVRRERFDLVLLDAMMPELDGYQVLAEMKRDEALRHIPVIMISADNELDSVIRCIKLGAEDHLPKPFNVTLLRARIGASLEKKRLRDQEQTHLRAIVEVQERLSAELADAASYVTSLFPKPIEEPPLRAEWRFLPCMELGGDAFGYDYIDPDHFAVYLLDVCGHGVGATLLSISVMNALRMRSFATVDFRDPGAVLSALNDRFPMDLHNNLHFTIWYGVYQRSTRQLTYASAGHPPAILLGPNGSDTRELNTEAPMIGIAPKVPYWNQHTEVEPGARVYVFSDGVYEIARPNGTMIAYDDFIAQLSRRTASQGVEDLDRMIQYAHEMHGSETLEDDYSIIALDFELGGRPARERRGALNAKCRMHSAKCRSNALGRSRTRWSRPAVPTVHERTASTDMHFALCILHSAFAVPP
jgi:phosphoserine phosphatase RsbU/P